MDTPILEVRDLVKNYGDTRALDGVTFSLAAGRIMGLMGPNGSGKSTLLKTVAGLLRPTAGGVWVCGFPVGRESKARVSYLHDNSPLYPWMRAEDAVDYYADFFTDFDRARAAELLKYMELDSRTRVRAMSKGMVEKLNLTLTFARAARLYLLDEPLGGIDPLARHRIVSTIIKAFRPDSSVLISTHLLNDIEGMFHDVVFIREGRIILSGDAETLRRERGEGMEQLYIRLYGGTEDQA